MASKSLQALKSFSSLAGACPQAGAGIPIFSVVRSIMACFHPAKEDFIKWDSRFSF